MIFCRITFEIIDLNDLLGARASSLFSNNFFIHCIRLEYIVYYKDFSIIYKLFVIRLTYILRFQIGTIAAAKP